MHSEKNKVRIAALALLFLGLLSASGSAAPAAAAADDGNAKWCRKEGGKVVDVIKLVKTTHGLMTTLQEGEDAPSYAEGFGMLKKSALFLAVTNLKSKETIFVEGTNLKYRSFNLDGTFRWEGSFYKCG